MRPRISLRALLTIVALVAIVLRTQLFPPSFSITIAPDGTLLHKGQPISEPLDANIKAYSTRCRWFLTRACVRLRGPHEHSSSRAVQDAIQRVVFAANNAGIKRVEFAEWYMSEDTPMETMRDNTYMSLEVK